eukprot:TRINITY_DN23910_c0_g2_i1.p1 TRINITY_DN23910_c0_g2~~TRINITY_DN23910_c0_g2_i1.p1  ORF type:complete len:583 (-),score=112.84 TRINITY_DN23910_c0_g2_i1:177-1925(-)
MERQLPSLPQRLHRALREELGRISLLELRPEIINSLNQDQHATGARGRDDGGLNHAPDEVSTMFARRLQSAWDEFAVVSKIDRGVEAEPPPSPKAELAEWTRRVEAGYKHLGSLTRQLNDTERAFAWSEVLFARETAYIERIQSFGGLGGGSGGDGVKLGNVARISRQSKEPFNPVAYREDIAELMKQVAQIREEAATLTLRRRIASQQENLREELRQMIESVASARAKRATEIDQIHGWLLGAGILLTPEDFPPPTGDAHRDGAEELLDGHGPHSARRISSSQPRDGRGVVKRGRVVPPLSGRRRATSRREGPMSLPAADGRNRRRGPNGASLSARLPAGQKLPQLGRTTGGSLKPSPATPGSGGAYGSPRGSGAGVGHLATIGATVVSKQTMQPKDTTFSSDPHVPPVIDSSPKGVETSTGLGGLSGPQSSAGRAGNLGDVDAGDDKAEAVASVSDIRSRLGRFQLVEEDGDDGTQGAAGNDAGGGGGAGGAGGNAGKADKDDMLSERLLDPGLPIHEMMSPWPAAARGGGGRRGVAGVVKDDASTDAANPLNDVISSSHGLVQDDVRGSKACFWLVGGG